MKKLAITAAVLAAAPAFADHGHSERVRTRLIGYQEVPSVSTVAEGSLVLDVAGNAQTIAYTLSYSGLQGQVRQAHIHFAQRAVNGPIVVWLCGTPANPGPAGTQTCPQSGSVSGTITAAEVLASPPAQQLAAGDILDLVAAIRAGAAYANVHTDISTGGEIRGQIGHDGRAR
jgi:hypothetical protein